jgi:hypothetical protein
MSSKSRISTTTYGHDNKINSVTNASSDGDSPHGEFVAGMTAGEIGKGHSMGHADYLSRTKSMEIYTGKSLGNGTTKGDSGLGEIKEFIGIMKTFLG